MSKEIVPAWQVAELIRPNVNVQVYTGPTTFGQDSRIVTRDVGGNANPKYLRDTSNVQVMVLSQDYLEGSELARTVVDSVLGQSPISYPEVVYIRFVLLNGPAYIGPNDQDMHMFTMTYEVTYEPEPSALSNREPID